MKRSEPKHTISIKPPAYQDWTHTCLPLLLGTATEKTQSCLLLFCFWHVHKMDKQDSNVGAAERRIGFFLFYSV